MRARVFVTLKPSVFDPQGTTVAERCTRSATRPSRTCGRASTSSSTSTRARADEARRLAAEAADKLLANPVIESYRIEVDRAQEARPMKFAVVVFPGSNCDHDALLRREARARPGRRARLAQGHEPRRRRRRSILPGGFAHGDYLRTGAIARFSPIMDDGDDVRRGRRAGARHLQRLPGAARGRACCRARCCATAACSSAASTCTSGSSRPTRRSPRPARPARCCACRSPTAKATTTPSRTSSRGSSEPAGGLPLRRRRRRGRPTRPTRTARSTTSPASATRRATSSA